MLSYSFAIVYYTLMSYVATRSGGECIQTHPGSSLSHLSLLHYYLMFYTRQILYIHVLKINIKGSRHLQQ